MLYINFYLCIHVGMELKDESEDEKEAEDKWKEKPSPAHFMAVKEVGACF